MTKKVRFKKIIKKNKKQRSNFLFFSYFPTAFLETKQNTHTISLTFFAKKQSAHNLYTNDSKYKNKNKNPYTQNDFTL